MVEENAGLGEGRDSLPPRPSADDLKKRYGELPSTGQGEEVAEHGSEPVVGYIEPVEGYRFSPRRLGLGAMAAVAVVSGVLAYRECSKPVDEPEVPATEVVQTEKTENPKSPEKPEPVKRYNFDSTERLKKYVDLKKGEFERNAEVAVTNLEGYHVLSRRVVDDLVGIEEYLLNELKREYRAVEDLEQADTNRTDAERKYRSERIESLEALRGETSKLLNDLQEKTSQPQPEDPARKVDEKLQRLDNAFPDPNKEPDPQNPPKTSYRGLNNAVGGVYALMMALNTIPTSLDTPIVPEMPAVEEVTGPAALYNDLTRLANERETEMNTFLDNRIASLKKELRNQISATTHMERYGALVKSKTGSLESKHEEFEQSVGWTEAETQRLNTLLGESGSE